MRNKVDVTKLLDGTEVGRLKARVFVYLNEQYPEQVPNDLSEAKEKVFSVFQSSEAVDIVDLWNNLTFK